jgi:hypothetical protein
MKTACEHLVAVDGYNSEVGVVLEYRIPRREKRLDAAYLFCNTVAVIEFKAGSASATSEAITQASDYCLDLAYYHAQSQGKKIVPIVCSTEAQSSNLNRISVSCSAYLADPKNCGFTARKPVIALPSIGTSWRLFSKSFRKLSVAIQAEFCYRYRRLPELSGLAEDFRESVPLDDGAVHVTHHLVLSRKFKQPRTAVVDWWRSCSFHNGSLGCFKILPYPQSDRGVSSCDEYVSDKRRCSRGRQRAK